MTRATRKMWCPDNIVVPSEMRDAAVVRINAGDESVEFHAHARGRSCAGFAETPPDKEGVIRYPSDVCWRYEE